jgi:hypothetical protein
MDPADPDAEGPAVLALHLRSWLGAWPPRAPVEVVGADVRTRPGWDGVVHPVTALSTPAGAVVSVPPAAADAVRAALAGVASLAEPGWRATLPDAVGLPGTRMTSTTPASGSR